MGWFVQIYIHLPPCLYMRLEQCLGRFLNIIDRDPSVFSFFFGHKLRKSIAKETKIQPTQASEHNPSEIQEMMLI